MNKKNRNGGNNQPGNAKSPPPDVSTDHFVEIINPYRPFDLEACDWLYHEDVIDQIKNKFENHPENKIIVLQGTWGSGKTNTLKRIESSPNLLGENYIPIYLDSRKYIGADSESFLFSVYEDVVEKASKFGYEIPKPYFVRERRIRGSTFESLLLLMDSYLRDNVLILIFDKFDVLLDNINIKVISDYVRYFKHIEKSWRNYGLILVGEGELVKLTNDESIKQILITAIKIEVEEVLKKESIERLIFEPLKDRVVYKDEAIEQIIWYSGKNLYFQQLICYYLVNLLNEQESTTCLENHVETAIVRILTEERPEFVSIWEKRLSPKARLIVSALADENVTKKRENFYFLEKSSLLDNIFGEEIQAELEELKKSGYTNEMKSRRFFESPFKIPILGVWVQNKYPFIRTVIENIEYIADRIDIGIFINRIKETPTAKLVPFDKEAIVDIAEKWYLLSNTIIKNQRTPEKDQIQSFLDSLSKFLNLQIQEKIQAKTDYFVIAIKSLNIGTLDEAFCFIQDRPELTTDDISNIQNIAASLAEDTYTKLTIFFYFHRSDMVESLVKRTYLNLIAIDENDLKKIIFSERPREAFRKLILSELSLQKVSPYRTSGPAKATFYGRSDTISKITRVIDTSYAIVGARKIGKSSLLHKIVDTPSPDTTYLFLELGIEFSNVRSYRTFLKSLGSEIKEIFKKEITFAKFPFVKDLSLLPKAIQDFSRKGKRIVIILDEVDALIKFDRRHNYKLLRMFHTMSHKDYCQFIFAGFEELYRRIRDIYNPMYNFCEEIILEPLERDDALDLITEPMKNIGVYYNNEEDRELILKYTACHPNLIQFFCKSLIEKIERHNRVKDRRTISKKDIEELFDNEYEAYIMDKVYMFFSDLSDIDRIIILLLADEQLKDPKEKTFSEDEIRNKLSNNGIKISTNDFHINIRNLLMRFIFREREKGKYCFALPVFPEILEKRIGDDYKSDLIKEIKRNE